MISDILEKIIKDSLEGLGLPIEKITLDHPVDLSHGDYATNVALILAKKVGKQPRELAEKIVRTIQDSRFKIQDSVLKIEVAEPGFINFYLSPNFFADSLEKIVSAGEKFGRNQKLFGQKIMVEYTDPNPFKPFHIGHLMSNTIGESVSRLFEFGGAKTIRSCWQGDVGLHVAKAMWGILEREKEFPGEDASLVQKTDFLGACYVLGAKKYEEDPEAKKEINILNKKIFDKSDEKINSFYEKGRKWSLEHFEEIYKKLGTSFTHYFFEGIEGRDGIKIVEDNLSKGIFEKSEGAVIFNGGKYGLHTRVFINSEGLPTYEAKELGLNQAKFKVEHDLNQSVIITGNEQNDYFKVLLKVLSIIFPEIGKKTIHIGHGMLQFASGKMSSRKGNVITGESLIQQIEELVAEKIKDRDLSEDERVKIKTAVAVGAIKYSVLKQAIGKNIVYDFDKSISFDGDSGPYLQYSYARAMSVLRKAQVCIDCDDSFTVLSQVTTKRSTQVEDSEVSTLEKILYRFEEVVERATKEMEPHYVATYLTELAGAFNSFYANNKILDAGDKTEHRLVIVKAFISVMKNGLNILAIPVLDKM